MHSPMPGWDLRPLFRPLKLCSLTLFGLILVPEIASSYTVWISHQLFASIPLQLLYFWLRMISPTQCWDLRPLFRPPFASFWSLKSRPPMQSRSCLKFWHAFCLHAVSTAAFCVSHAFLNAMLGFTPLLSACGGLAIRLFRASFWLLQSRPPMQSGSCFEFWHTFCWNDKSRHET